MNKATKKVETGIEALSPAQIETEKKALLTNPVFMQILDDLTNKAHRTVFTVDVFDGCDTPEKIVQKVTEIRAYVKANQEILAKIKGKVLVKA